MKNEIAEKIRGFLADHGYTFGSWGSCEHSVGMDYYCARIKPSYSPVDGAYTIAVDPEKVTAWVCYKPYNYTLWFPRWQKRYQSKEELLSILNDAVHPPTGCW